MNGMTIKLFDNTAAAIRPVLQSPRSTDSDDEERVAPFTTSPLEDCRCISSDQKSNMTVRDGRKKNKENTKKRSSKKGAGKGI